MRDIDPKDLMAVERAVTGLLGTAISLIVLGFVVEKFELFLHLIEAQKKLNIPQLSHIWFYKYLGIGIIFGGILLALFTYRYYIKWIEHLKRGEVDTDKSIYLILSIFIGLIGTVLIVSMVIF